METYGDLSGIVFNRRTARLIGGHQRLKHFDRERDVVITERFRKPNAQGTAAVGYLLRGTERWLFREVDVDEATELEMNLRANQPAGAWDPEGLRAVVLNLKSAGRDLDILGFDAQALQKLLAQGGAAAALEPPEAPVPAKPRSRAGTIYPLGRHRLAAGDCRNGKLVEKLLEGVDPACVYTDPPYGVDYRGGQPILNDQRRGDDLATFLTNALRPAVRRAKDTAAFYIWHADETRRDFDQALIAAGLQERQQIVWVKPAIVLGWGDYLSGHEPCYYASKAGLTPAYHGDRTQPTVWRLAALTPDGGLQVVIGPGVLVSDGQGTQVYVTTAPPKGKKVRHLRLADGQTLILGHDAGSTAWEFAREQQVVHPTQKPVALAVRALLNSTREGEWVYDAFAGSGNTLLAAEQIGRCAAIVEEDLGYCDVIRQRFADLVQDRQWSPTQTLRTTAPPPRRPSRKESKP